MSQDKIILSIEKRELQGKKLKKLRARGIVPAVVYGAKQEPINVQIEMNPLLKIIATAGTHTPIDLVVDGKAINVLIKSVERDVVKRTPIAVDFQAIAADQIVKTEIPLHITDEDDSVAKKSGLIILQDIERVEVKAKPADLPEALTVSAAKLEKHGDKLLISDIIVPAGVEILHENPELTIASVFEPSVIAAQNAALDEKNKEEKPAEEGAETTETTEAETDETAPAETKE
ncbi:MAG: 50S ribosomal protein L25 [Candidatus Nomurabacteria bacterium]|jgi:large subunit ribosomal protein L25|nr:50S ribosomal protein L25 [Candidatus Nomurabacteria bacterium]